MSTPFNLERFVAAQESSYDDVKAELSRGWKQTHWMWFVFPQVSGLGRSAIAQAYAISGATEAEAYLDHPVLGGRLIECCNTLLQLEGRSAQDILGQTDALKLRSSMTLFTRATDNPVFLQVLLKYYDGEEDAATLEILGEL